MSWTSSIAWLMAAGCVACTWACIMGQEVGKPGGAKPATGTPGQTEKLVRVTGDVAKTVFAAEPKPLSDSVKRGLRYLVQQQRADGGWNQGGGWRTDVSRGGRIEGPNVADPSDVGNTAFALLALIRAGNTPKEGEYKEAVSKGLEFILRNVEKADWDSLRLGDVQGTQLQSKIGRYVDLFAANWVLAELHGRCGDAQLEERVANALEKTMTKIVRSQRPDGTFAGNEGWASTLSVGVANKSVARAKERGVVVDEAVVKRIVAQAENAFTRKPAEGGLLGGGGGFGLAAAPGASDAGVRLYGAAQGASNFQDAVNSLRREEMRARQILQDKNASPEMRQRAQEIVETVEKLERQNALLQAELRKNIRDARFLQGFGSNGGEEFLSFLNIGETLVLTGGKEWEEWDARMRKGLEAAQNPDGSWYGQHCITGRTFCTAAALLVLMTDRTPFTPETISAARQKQQSQKNP
jgi:hypothetical protein